MQIYEYSLVKVVILVRNLLDHFQLVGLDVLLEHNRSGVAGDVIDVVADGKIIERHIAKRPQQFVAIVVHRPVPVEEMALYQ